MKKLIYFALPLVAICLFSCGNKSSLSQEQVDSLSTSLEQRNADYQQLDEFLNVVAAALDSIDMQESEIFQPGSESPVPNQAKIKSQLSNLKKTLKDQRERISELEKQLSTSSANGKKLQRIISALKAQIADKEAQIAKLQEESKDKDITIEGLNTYTTELKQQSAEQQTVIETQSETIAAQDQQLNEGYVIMATKSALKDAGLLKGGFLKKSKVDVSSINKSMANTIDIRKTTEIKIASKNATILSQMPQDSYTIEKKDKNNSVLRISNPARFWSVTRYLIIQTD